MRSSRAALLCMYSCLHKNQRLRTGSGCSLCNSTAQAYPADAHSVTTNGFNHLTSEASTKGGCMCTLRIRFTPASRRHENRSKAVYTHGCSNCSNVSVTCTGANRCTELLAIRPGSHSIGGLAWARSNSHCRIVLLATV